MIQKILFFFFILLIFECKKSDKNPKLLNQKEEENITSFEILFLQKDHEFWDNIPLEFTFFHLQESYKKIGIPNSSNPEFLEDGCFYYLDPFYFYNEFGLSVRYCNLEILKNYKSLKNIINHINETISLENLNLDTIEIKKVNHSFFKNQKFEMIYNTFLEFDLQESSNIYLFSNRSFEKKQKMFFIPKRFYEVEYAVFFKDHFVFFLYKKDSNYFYVRIKDKKFYESFFRLLFNLKDFLNNFQFQEKEIYISKVLFKDKINAIRISTNQDYVYTYLPTSNKYIFIFPFSHLVLNKDEIELEFRNPLLTVFFENPLNFNLYFKKGILRNHWMVWDKEQFIPLEICLWKKPCSIRDLSYNDFVLDIETSSCDLEKLKLTELNPFGIRLESSVSPYGKFIEILSLQNCNNQIYLNFSDVLLSFPERIQEGYYIFTGSDSYYLTDKILSYEEITRLNTKDSILVVQFFPYKEKILFKGIQENSEIFFLYGDKNNQIFSPVHSFSILDETNWEFHSGECKGLINCYMGMSPGFKNPISNSNKICFISEIFIGGPKTFEGKRISEDEFIEFECIESVTNHKNFIEIKEENKNSKKYYFPSPKPSIDRFLIFQKQPRCIVSENYITNSNFFIPNRSFFYKTNTQSIFISNYELYQYVNHQIPKSLNFIKDFSIVLPTRKNQNLNDCIGNATPNRNNIHNPFFFSLEYDDKNFTLVSSTGEFVKIYNSQNQILFDDFVEKNQIVPFNSTNLGFKFPYQKDVIKIVFDNEEEQYVEVFSVEPLCFIESLQPNQIEWLRVCFLKEHNLNLYLEDFQKQSILIPYGRKFSYANLPENLQDLEKHFYRIEPQTCFLIVEPKANLLDITFNQPKFPFIDKYLLTSQSNSLGNGITDQEAVQIFSYINNQKIKLCSYGNVEFRKVPFRITNNKIARNQYEISNKFFGNFNFNLENIR